ncbi:Leukotoxin [Acaryochloris thomasi RCC1774]|uniref:Leukotoxin n=1 Tax=Acaryochloris thomasi RCC1774 TaxID=1764569 RepID=A0A2W1J9H8_9CYAN|nr:calcium-binding protein [Acaryochloris thomasi]PZD70718.1 Leukotoxin [Acaryochloris thomasi RCC1774]
MNEESMNSFEFDVTLFSGQNFDGDFSYDTSVITGNGEELARIEDDLGDFKLTLNIFGETFTEENDIDFGDGEPPFPFATFEDGEIQGIDYLPSADDVGVEGFGGFFIRQSELLFVEDAYFEVAGQGLTPVPVAGFNTELVGIVDYEGQAFNTVAGTEIGDFLQGTKEDDRIFAREGSDRVFARRGDDFIRGGDGADLVNGGKGDDTLIGEAGADILNGGRGNDDLQGGDQADLLQGKQGDDTLAGDDGRDTLMGGRGSDSLSGGSGADQILGNRGADTLIGGAGNDTLVGGAGADLYTYDTGVTFVRRDVGSDQIQGFVAGQDKIALGLTTFDTLSSVAGDGFSVAADFEVVNSTMGARQSLAEIVYQTNTGDLFYNQNGANAGFGEGGLLTTFTDNPGLSTSDFILL